MRGDYRIENSIPDTEDPTVVRAVLDWELSTLGDHRHSLASTSVDDDRAGHAVAILISHGLEVLS